MFVITEVRVKLMNGHADGNEKLAAFCSVTFDGAFCVRDLKLVEGGKGLFLSMPSRKLTDRCGGCGFKNALQARFCNQCGTRLGTDRACRDEQGKMKLHADVAHPISSEAREVIKQAVLAAYAAEKERAQQPGYCSDYDSKYRDREAT